MALASDIFERSGIAAKQGDHAEAEGDKSDIEHANLHSICRVYAPIGLRVR